MLLKKKGGVKEMSDFSKEKLDKVWEKGSTVRGKNPDLYRKDPFGNTMYKPSYGKETSMGWEVDHIKPQAKGGTDHLNNLQPMNPEANRKKGDKY
ncbi:HNH endonuclease [Bacteroidales bacterium Barb7]|nr:HNH endonuclease [Bacteroidales bacterium Barb7]